MRATPNSYRGFNLTILGRQSGWVVHIDGIGKTMCFERVEDAIKRQRLLSMHHLDYAPKPKVMCRMGGAERYPSSLAKATARLIAGAAGPFERVTADPHHAME